MALEDYGWCHNCMTWQLYFDAPELPIPYWRNEVHKCCVVCREDEPWSMAVWNPHQFVEDGVVCEDCVRELCEQRVIAYPSDTPCHHVREVTT